jgi:hypothetical protein
MNKKWQWVLWGSISLNVILIFTFIFSSNSEEAITIPLTERTQQKIENSIDVQIGMSVEQLLKTMGKPIKRDAEKNIEEWYYCRTGTNVDEFVQISITAKKVIKLNNYVVSGIDTNGLIGDCELFIKYYTRLKTPNKSSNSDIVNAAGS